MQLGRPPCSLSRVEAWQALAERCCHGDMPPFTWVAPYAFESICSYASARLAQSAERKALNLVVVGSSPTVGVFRFGALACGIGILPEQPARTCRGHFQGICNRVRAHVRGDALLDPFRFLGMCRLLFSLRGEAHAEAR